MKDLHIHPTAKSRISTVDFNNLPFGKIVSDHMFEMDFDGSSWINPQIHPVENMDVSPMNMALHYGQSIFEGMKATRTQAGQPILFRPEQHAKRLNASARRMCMPEMDEALFIETVQAMVSVDHEWIPRTEGSALYIRPFMFAWDNMIGVRPSDTYKFIIICLPVGPYYPKPIKLLVETKYIRAAKGGVGEAKTAGNYAAAMYPAKLAREKGYDQVIWLDTVHRKYVQEVGTMNIFFVFNDEIVTPATSGAILKGITRMSAIEVLEAKGYKVNQRDISIDEIAERYHKKELVEIFGTGTAALIANVQEVSIEGETLSLPSDQWNLSTMIRETINGVRYGKIPDSYGWTVPVDENADLLVG